MATWFGPVEWEIPVARRINRTGRAFPVTGKFRQVLVEQLCDHRSVFVEYRAQFDINVCHLSLLPILHSPNLVVNRTDNPQMHHRLKPESYHADSVLEQVR